MLRIPCRILLVIFMTIGLSACLKTRAQLESDNANPTAEGPAPIPGKVEPVEPQGGYILDEIKAEITRLNGRVEDLERAKQSQAAEEHPNPEKLKDLENRIIELEQSQQAILIAMKKWEAKNPPPEQSDLFKKGKGEFTAGKWNDAIGTFAAYLSNPSAKQVEEATFLKAEAYYQLKEYKKAIIEYSKFPEKYSKSKFMSKALYKIGLSFESLGMKDDAKPFFQELLDKFSKTPEAALAQKRLAGKG